MKNQIDFTNGRIVLPLLRFVGPVFLALFLQSMYGAVDLMIVGKFADPADVSAVATGSQITQTITGLIAALSLGMTISIGLKIGMGQREKSGEIAGSGIMLHISLHQYSQFTPMIPPIHTMIPSVHSWILLTGRHLQPEAPPDSVQNFSDHFTHRELPKIPAYSDRRSRRRWSGGRLCP